MTGLLDGGISALFGAAFGSIYLPATLHGTAGPVYDGAGNITGWDAAEQLCRAQIDAADWQMRQAEGYVDGDCKVIVLASGLAKPPTNDSEITVEAPQYAVEGGFQRWKLMSVSMDPAGAYYFCRARRS